MVNCHEKMVYVGQDYFSGLSLLLASVSRETLVDLRALSLSRRDLSKSLVGRFEVMPNAPNGCRNRGIGLGRNQGGSAAEASESDI